jgi:ribosomal protein L7/L12
MMPPLLGIAVPAAIAILAILGFLTASRAAGGGQFALDVEGRLDALLAQAGVKVDPLGEESAAVQAALRRGDRIAAIKAYRESALTGLEEAKDHIDGLAPEGRVRRKLDALLAHAGAVYDPLAGTPPAILDAIRRGETIRAIKLHRQATGVSLKDAKDHIEALTQRFGR